jgi:hypothetical protein
MRNNPGGDSAVCQDAGVAGVGLVPYTTSGPGQFFQGFSGFIDVPASEARLRRMKHHVRTAGRLMGETMERHGRGFRALFVTLTYRRAENWKPRHIADFWHRLRKWSGRKGFKVGYVWVSEMQRRGAVHYHACIWLPAKCGIPRPDKRGWWPHGSTNVQAVRRNCIGYLMKYVSKGCHGDDPELPRGARICGSGGLDELAGHEFHYWRLPRYVRENVVIGERCRRVKGGGWASRDTGQYWCSEYGLHGIARVRRGADCRGAPRRSDTVCMLHADYKRVQGGRAWDETLTDCYRETLDEQCQLARVQWAVRAEERPEFLQVVGQFGALVLVREPVL